MGEPNETLRRIIITDELRALMTAPPKIDFAKTTDWVGIILPSRLRLNVMPLPTPIPSAPPTNPFQLKMPQVGAQNGLPWKLPQPGRFEPDPQTKSGSVEDILNAIMKTPAVAQKLEEAKERAKKDALKLWEKLKDLEPGTVASVVPIVTSVVIAGAVLVPKYNLDLPPLKGIPLPIRGLTLDLQYAKPDKEITGGIDQPNMKEFRGTVNIDLIELLIPKAK